MRSDKLWRQSSVSQVISQAEGKAAQEKNEFGRCQASTEPDWVTTVELLQVRHNVEKVRGLDAIDGTPVLVLKPYLPPFDCRPAAKIPEWVERLMEGYF